jgi:hypothetical protein
VASDVPQDQPVEQPGKRVIPDTGALAYRHDARVRNRFRQTLVSDEQQAPERELAAVLLAGSNREPHM